MTVLDVSIVNVALSPRSAKSPATSPARACNGVITAYAITFGRLPPARARPVRPTLLGRRPRLPLRCARVHRPPRFLCGPRLVGRCADHRSGSPGALGAAIITPAALSIVHDDGSTKGRRNANKALGIWGRDRRRRGRRSGVARGRHPDQVPGLGVDLLRETSRSACSLSPSHRASSVRSRLGRDFHSGHPQGRDSRSQQALGAASFLRRLECSQPRVGSRAGRSRGSAVAVAAASPPFPRDRVASQGSG